MGLDEAYEALDKGDVAEARRLAEAAAKVDEDAEEAQELLALVDRIERGVEPLHAPVEAEPVDPFPFSCLACGGTSFRKSRALASSRVSTLFGVDELSRGALVHACTDCGLLHWFQDASPGALQRLKSAGLPAAPPSDGFSCLVCGHGDAVADRRLLNTRAATLLGFDWANRGATTLRCRLCGALHWFDADEESARAAWRLGDAPVSPPSTPVDPDGLGPGGLRCLVCGDATFSSRTVLVNERATTRFDLDWLDPGARIVRCSRCHHLLWFQANSVAAKRWA